MGWKNNEILSTIVDDGKHLKTWSNQKLQGVVDGVKHSYKSCLASEHGSQSWNGSFSTDHKLQQTIMWAGAKATWHKAQLLRNLEGKLWSEAAERHSRCHISVCCSVAKSCPTLWNPMDCSTPGFPVLHHLPEFAQTHVDWVGDAIQQSHPLSGGSALFPLSRFQKTFRRTTEAGHTCWLTWIWTQRAHPTKPLGWMGFHPFLTSRACEVSHSSLQLECTWGPAHCSKLRSEPGSFPLS